MSYEDTAGLNVFTHYGPRETEDGVLGGGELPGKGSIQEVVVYVKDTDFGSDETFDTQRSLPAGAIPIDATFDVEEAITQTGGTTSLTLNVGTNGSEGTNGFSISDAATSISTTTEVDSSGAGTWAAALAAETAIGVSLVAGGGTITSVDGGKVKIVIRYRKI
jgi:hypothetical protein